MGVWINQKIPAPSIFEFGCPYANLSHLKLFMSRTRRGGVGLVPIRWGTQVLEGLAFMRAAVTLVRSSRISIRICIKFCPVLQSDFFLKTQPTTRFQLWLRSLFWLEIFYWMITMIKKSNIRQQRWYHHILVYLGSKPDVGEESFLFKPILKKWE